MGPFRVALLIALALAGCWQTPAWDFILSLAPTSLTVQPGESGTTTLTLTPQNGFTGTVSLALLNGPNGVYLSPTSFRVSGTNPLRENLRVTVASDVAPGTYPLTLKGTSGNIAKTVPFTLTVTAPPPAPDFTLSLGTTDLTVQQGQSWTTTLTVSPKNGFTGTVSLSLVDRNSSNSPSGITFSPASVTVSSSPAIQALTLNVASSVAPGTYALTLRGTSGGLTRTVDLTLTVSSPPPTPGFTLTLSPDALIVQQGSSGTMGLTITPQNEFTGTVSLALVDGNGNPFPGVTLSPTGVTVTGNNPVTQTLTINVSASMAAGTYPLTLKGTSGSLTETVPLTLTVALPPDFTLSLSPSTLTVQQGGSGNTQLTVTPQNGFTGTVGLTLVGAPAGVSISPTSVPVTGSSPAVQTLTVSVASSVATGTYTLTLKGTSGSLSRTTTLTLTVTTPPSDFNMVLESNTLSLPPGGTAYVRLSVTGSGGTLTLQLVDAQGNPFTPVVLSPTSTPIPSAPVLELRASPSLAPGTYPLKVRGTSGALTQEVGLTLQVNGQTGQNLSIARVEWGQSVLKESLRLVAGKEVLLRVHLVASPSPISLSAPLSGAVYEGSTFRGNLTFTCPNPLPTATLQGDLATTCNTTLPGSWVTPGLRAELRADPNNQVAEMDENDNTRTLTPQVGAGTALHLTVVPVVHQGVTATVPSFAETLLAVWPLKDVNHATRAPYTYAGTLSPTDSNTWSDLLDELRILRQMDGSGRYYYGFVRVGYTSGIAGIGYLGFPVAVGWDYAGSAPAVMAHELGHNFGRSHAPCGVSGDPNYPYPNATLGTWGYDRRNNSLKDPNAYRDLMGYCSPLWISDYTYEGAQGFLEANPPQAQSVAPLALGEEVLLFTALVVDGKVELRPPLQGPFRPEGKPSSYRLVVDGTSYPVYLLEDSEGGLHLQAVVPVGDYRRVALYERERLLVERTASLTPQALPQVGLREEGGEVAVRVVGGTHFALFHIAEDGTRTALTLFHPVGEARIPIGGLPPGGRYEVQVTDGLRVVRFAFPR